MYVGVDGCELLPALNDFCLFLLLLFFFSVKHFVLHYFWESAIKSFNLLSHIFLGNNSNFVFFTILFTIFRILQSFWGSTRQTVRNVVFWTCTKINLIFKLKRA